MTYKILFIDEQREAHRSFKTNFLDNHKDKFTGSYIYPEPTLEDMIEVIIKESPDAVLTDYSLNDYKTDIKHEVQYNGGHLAIAIHEMRQGFPIFITTSLGDDAARDGADVKIIYEKYGSFTDTGSEKNQSGDQHLTFADRLYHEIRAYKNFLEYAVKNFDDLLDKRNSSGAGLTAQEEEKLIELDGIIENLIDKRSSIPDTIKEPSNVQRLNDLLSLAQKILSKGNHVKDRI